MPVAEQLHLEVPGFSGSLSALLRALEEGRLSRQSLPLLSLIDQALAQIRSRDLEERSELLPHLAELLLLKLRPLPPEPEGEAPLEAPPVLQALMRLDAPLSFLEARLKERAHVLPVPPPPPPRSLRLPRLSPKLLLEALPPPFPAFELRGGQLNLKAIAQSILAFLAKTPRTLFSLLPLPDWRSKIGGFLILLEEVRRGHLELIQRTDDLEVQRKEAYE